MSERKKGWLNRQLEQVDGRSPQELRAQLAERDATIAADAAYFEDTLRAERQKLQDNARTIAMLEGTIVGNKQALKAQAEDCEQWRQRALAAEQRIAELERRLNEPTRPEHRPSGTDSDLRCNPREQGQRLRGAGWGQAS